MKQRDLEALAARYFAAPEADEALLAEEARMRATLPEAWRATLAETAGFHDWHLLELSLRGEAALLRLRADNGKKRARLRFDGVSHLRLHGDLSGAAGDGRVQRRRGHPPAEVLALWMGREGSAYAALALLDNGRWLCLRAREAACTWEKGKKA